MKTTIIAVIAAILTVGAAVADSVTARLDTIGGCTQQAVLVTVGDIDLRMHDQGGPSEQYVIGAKVGTVRGSAFKIVGRFFNATDTWAIQPELSLNEKVGTAKVSGCIAGTLPMFGCKACVYSPGLFASWAVSNQARLGVTGVFNQTSGQTFSWNAGPEISVKVSDRVSVGYRNTCLGNGVQEDQLKATLSW